MLKSFCKKGLALLLLLCLLLPAPLALGEEPLVVEAGPGGAQLRLDPKTMNLSFTPRGSELGYSILALESTSGSRAMKNLQKSAVSVQFIANEQSGTINSMDSYAMSVDLGNAIYEALPQGFRIHYTIGSNELVVDDLPKSLPLSTYTDRLKPAWTTREDKLFRDNYRVVPRGEGESVFVRIKDDLGKLAISQLHMLLFEKGGYTTEELERDNAAFGHVIEYVNPKVSLVMDLVLDGDDLLLHVPLELVEFTKGNDLVSLDLLPYFLRADSGEGGYFFVPDGSGGLIDFNNQRLGIAAYAAAIYGRDPLIRVDEYRPNLAPVSLPVYGIKQDEGAVLAIIEEGAELATINAAVTGHSDQFNRIYSSFTIRNIERVAMGSNKTVTTPRYAEDSYQGSIRLRYRFLPGADQGYVQMAKAYQGYLLGQGSLSIIQEPSPSAPLFVELVGAFGKKKFFLGIPYDSTEAATTIAQAGLIYQRLKDAGISNIHLLYNGLFPGGVKHGLVDNGRLDGAVGNVNGLRSLAELLAGQGDTLYPVLNLGKVYSTRGFSVTRHAARQHDGETARIYQPFEARLTGMVFPGSAYLSPQYLPEYAGRSLDRIKGFGSIGLNVQDLGNTLTGTYKRGEHVSPIHARPYVEAALGLITDQPLMLDSPNAYALPYADLVSKLPQVSSGHKMISTSVPFIQLVYDGCLVYSGPSWNLSAQEPVEKLLLHALESRTAPRFTLSYQKPTVFHDTQDQDFLGYFATWYQDSLDTVFTVYQAYDAFYQQVKGARILDHQLLGPQQRQVVYDNGITLLLNFANQEASVLGQLLPPLGYVILGGHADD